jgi:predicted AlkP superfamily pyrophosphatase or phosphodiesterase
MNKLILVLLDGLRADTARSRMGFLNHLAEQGEAAFLTVQSELPSLSRPLYETILTGKPVIRHGITGNAVVRRSTSESLFDIVRAKGGRTAAAAYSWISELYAACPFNPLTDRDQCDEAALIQAGRYYWEDDYPDTHLFADAESLRRQHEPDFLLVHSMNADDRGHRFGGGSKEYEGRAILIDQILASCLPLWRSAGYAILVTADHGMDELGFHGGTSDSERRVPLFLWADPIRRGYIDLIIPQLQVAALACRLLGVSPGSEMAVLGAEARKLFI